MPTDWEAVFSTQLDPRSGNFEDPARLGLADPVSVYLKGKFASGVYRHQYVAVAGLKAGRNVCLSTATASGKTLAFMMAGLDILARDPAARILAIYPQTALGVEQERRWAEALQSAGVDAEVNRIDGSIPTSERLRLLRRSRVVVATPDVVHAWFMTRLGEPAVRDFFGNLKLLVVDENSGGPVLSYSDLLLSIATAQWKKLPAREAIHTLVDELNDTRMGFSFSKDFVLKGGLMLSDISSVGFKVTNFTAANMATLEQNWKRIETALRLTVHLVADLGFSGQTLRADSALLPIAYYLYRRDAKESYLTSSSTQEDRLAIRQWLIRSLLKSGIWGSGLDTLLTAIRTTLQENDSAHFPLEAIQSTMARRGRVLEFTEEEIEDLLDAHYGDRRIFPVLALLYPYFDLRQDFHIDHVYPRSLFTPAKLRAVGVHKDDVEEVRDHVDYLPNLQLLVGPLNQSKNDLAPLSWIERSFPNEKAAKTYINNYDLAGLSATTSPSSLTSTMRGGSGWGSGFTGCSRLQPRFL